MCMLIKQRPENPTYLQQINSNFSVLIIFIDKKVLRLLFTFKITL